MVDPKEFQTACEAVVSLAKKFPDGVSRDFGFARFQEAIWWWNKSAVEDTPKEGEPAQQ